MYVETGVSPEENHTRSISLIQDLIQRHSKSSYFISRTSGVFLLSYPFIKVFHEKYGSPGIDINLTFYHFSYKIRRSINRTKYCADKYQVRLNRKFHYFSLLFITYEYKIIIISTEKYSKVLKSIEKY